MTEQGETVTARYGRPEIARRDLEQMVNAVLLGSIGPEGTQVPEANAASARPRWSAAPPRRVRRTSS